MIPTTPQPSRVDIPLAKVQGILAFAFLLLPSCFCLLPSAFVASAHNVKTTADVGGTLHIQPNDNPRAGEPSQVWIALTRKGGKVIPLKECNCQLAVYAEPHSPKEPALLEPSLQAITAERYKGIPGSEITFPKPGAYLLQLSGKPASGESFRPFKLNFEVTVAAGSVSATETQNIQNVNDVVEDRKSGFIPIAIALSALAAGGIIFVVLQRRRNGE
ncbi:hypothetical protein NIES4075_15630 [Tolypothrix sp. NIES-4075]|uniref:hypothetical protein n=1 Tax=Tolypothrix sp. NIES-4075 TaxID=2005459 RepID=UPI000B6B5B4A|nr:hypothetical protein [Tolypothrix sp. NIES-4075]GAX40597.1 hypothetical protein NIES4075_15630 [Tolypothrix sp. NIES-4075]